MSARIRMVGLGLALAIGTFGCLIRGTARTTVSEPSLVLIHGDVWVVEAYDEPVFYTEGYYWRWRTGVWYRSDVYSSGWVVYREAPATIRSINNPRVYAHYSAPAGARKRVGPPDHAPAHGVRGTEPARRKEAAGSPPAHDSGRRDHVDNPDKGSGDDQGHKGAKADKPDKHRR